MCVFYAKEKMKKNLNKIRKVKKVGIIKKSKITDSNLVKKKKISFDSSHLDLEERIKKNNFLKNLIFDPKLKSFNVIKILILLKEIMGRIYFKLSLRDHKPFDFSFLKQSVESEKFHYQYIRNSIEEQ